MVAIPFPLSTSPGHRAQEAAGRIVNGYAEPIQGVPQRQAIWRRMAGLKTFGTSTQSGFRGMISIPGTLYAVFENRVVRFTSSGGAATIHGNLSGEKKCFLARDNNSTPNVVVVDVDNGASIITSSSVENYPAPSLPQPNSVCWLGGYFFFTIGNGRCYASGINTTDVNANDFITAESSPDGLLRAIPFSNQLLLFGPNSCEFWSGAVVNDTGFPFNRVTATPHGLSGRYAIAGHEDGFGRALLWVGTDNRVKMLTGGYDPTDVSPAWLDRLIAAIEDKDTLEASIHIADGVPWWTLSSATWTVALNLNTLKWSERESWSEAEGLFTRWRGTQACFAFGKWLTGDMQSGNILEIDPEAHTEAGAVLRFRLESLPAMNFPNRIRVARAEFDVTTGVGIATGAQPIETDPTIEISWCDDGLNWSNPLQRKLGPQAKAGTREIVTRTGMSGPAGRRWRIDVSDPVDVAVMGGEMSAELKAT